VAREARLSHGIAEIGKTGELTTKDTKGHQGAGDRMRKGFADLDRSAPGYPPQEAKSALAWGPDCAARLYKARREA